MRNFKNSTWKPNSSKTLCFLTKLVEIYISEFFVDFQPISTKAQFLKIYKKNLTFPTHFRKLAEGIFLLISISKCFFFWFYFFENSYNFSRAAKRNVIFEKFWNVDFGTEFLKNLGLGPSRPYVFWLSSSRSTSQNFLSIFCPFQ